jgi:CheY-like chemotaxis protein
MRATHKVLVVDDDPVIGKSFDRVLSQKGYAVITVESGAEALKKLAAEDYDVVYTDIRMPGISGLEVAEQIKAQRPWTPVVIITGFGSEEHELRARKAGVSAFLHKPLSPDMIVGSAAAALEAVAAPVAIPVEPESARKTSTAKNIATFIAAPFAGLAFIIAFPVVALASLIWLGAKAAGRHEGIAAAAQVAKNIGLFLVSPFIALAYMAALPMVAGYALVTLGLKAAGKNTVMHRSGQIVRNIGTFLAAPFIGLAYIIAFPVVGLLALAWLALSRATGLALPTAAGKVARNVGLFIAAPFIALAYVIFFPVVAMGMLVWFGGRAWINGSNAG